MPSTPATGLFVAGTDTGVGKTLVTCAIVSHLRELQFDAVGFKPVASGSVDGHWEDAAHLHAASGRCEPLETLCPLRFHPPLAPTLAARKDGRDPDLAPSRKKLTELRQRHAAVIVEGVGGLLVPLDAKTLVLDFAREAGFPVLLVCRAALGTMNHTLLSLRELERAELSVAGIIMNVTRPEDAAVADETREEIERIAGRKFLATVPFIPADQTAEQRWRTAAQALERQASLRALLPACVPRAKS